MKHKRIIERHGINTIGAGFAVLLLSYSFSIATPDTIATSAKSMFANAVTTVGASVPANPYNTLAASLDARANELNAKEAELARRELAMDTPDNSWAVYSLIASLILFVLVGMNFYFDLRRNRRSNYGSPGTLRVNLKQ